MYPIFDKINKINRKCIHVTYIRYVDTLIVIVNLALTGMVLIFVIKLTRVLILGWGVRVLGKILIHKLVCKF